MKAKTPFFLVLLLSGVSQAAVTFVGNSANNNAGGVADVNVLNHGFTPSSTDLLHGLAPVVEGSGSFGVDGGNIARLNDGLFPAIVRPTGSQPAAYKAIFADGGYVGPGETQEKGGQYVSYILNASADIGTIVSYSGWQDGGRDAQNYNIYFLSEVNYVAGNYSNWTLVNPSPINYNPTLPNGSTPSAGMVTVTDDRGTIGGSLGVGVRGILIEFLGTEGGIRYSGYAEFDVFAIPEPSTILLLGVGSLALLRRRRAQS